MDKIVNVKDDLQVVKSVLFVHGKDTINSATGLGKQFDKNKQQE